MGQDRNTSNQDSTVNLYKKLLKEHGLSLGALGCAKGKQFLRYNQLTSLFNLEASSILDVGCGFGDFCRYLSFLGIENYSYMGIDLMEEFIDEAKKRYTSQKNQFVFSDFLSLETEKTFDYVISSGAFNSKIEEPLNGYEYIHENIKKMLSIANKAVAIDFLSDKVDHAYEHNFNSSPEKILSMAYKFSRNVVLRNDYFPFEFSLIIYKDDSFKKENTVFNSIENKIKWLGM
jgi:SAM-dependent methyltransferase